MESWDSMIERDARARRYLDGPRPRRTWRREITFVLAILVVLLVFLIA